MPRASIKSYLACLGWGKGWEWNWVSVTGQEAVKRAFIKIEH